MIIIVDMGSDGHKPVEISNAEYDILLDLEKQYGTIHDAMNKLPKKHGLREVCIDIMNRKPAKSRSFIFYA